MKHWFLAVSAVLVTFGANAAETDKFPEIVALHSLVHFEGRTESPARCTGTWIHPRLLLTAAHCVRHFNILKLNGHVLRASDASGRPVADLTAGPKDVYVGESRWWGTKKHYAAKIHVSEHAQPVQRNSLNLSYVEQDLAIIEFAQDMSSITRRISERPPTHGESVMMVGFGNHGAFSGSRPRHWGRNSVDQFDGEMIVSNGSAESCTEPRQVTEDWATCGGDSGGPLLDATTGQIIGVASTSMTPNAAEIDPRGLRKLSVHIDVTAPLAQQFIQGVLRSVTGAQR